MIIRKVGSLVHCSTIRLESKNGVLKRKVRQGNNLKNVTKSILRAENELQAIISYEGAFKESKLIVGKSTVPQPGELLQLYLNEHFSNDGNYFVEDITFKGTLYCAKNNHSILYYNNEKTDFKLGIILQIIIQNEVENEQRVIIVYQTTALAPISDFGVFHVKKCEKIEHICISRIATFHPIYLHNTADEDEMPNLFLTLHVQPFLE